ncbi:MAG: carbohydrate ABC transporter permease [Anaerolineae bacterium]
MVTVSVTSRRGFGGLLRTRGFKEAALGILFALPWLIRLVVLHIYPMLAAFYYSLTRYTIATPPAWVGLDNYHKLFFRDALPMQALYNSAYYSLGSVPLSLVLALFLAVLLNQKVRGLSLFRSVFFIPSVVPAVASAVLWMWLLNPRVGLINFLLTQIGLPRVPWLSSAAWIKPAFILMSLWGIGWTTVIFVAGLQDVPAHLYEAAEIDGAGVWSKFWNVTLPMLSPTVFFNLVMGVISSLQIFGPAFIILKGPTGGPQNAALFYVLYLFRQGFQYFEMGYASALAVFIFAVILLLTLLIFRSSAAWVYYESTR